MADLVCSLYRGRYSVELHLSFLRLQGQANDFKIQYSSVVRLFLLPKVLIPYPDIKAVLFIDKRVITFYL